MIKRIMFIGPYPAEGCGIAKYEKAFIDEFSKCCDVSHFQVNFMRSKNPFAFSGALKHIEKTNPDLVFFEYTPTIYGPLFSMFLRKLKARGCRIMINSHEDIRVYYPYLKSFRGLLDLHEKSVLRHCDFYVVHNRRQMEFLAKKFPEWRDKIKLIPLPVLRPEKSLQSRTAVLGRYGLPAENKKAIAFFGQIRRKKGLDLLADAVAQLKEETSGKFNLFIMGAPVRKDRKYLSGVKEKFSAAKNVFFTGFVDGRDIPALLRSTDLLVMPYRNCTESATVYSEAVPYNVPILASDAGGLKKVSELGLGRNFRSVKGMKKEIENFVSGKWRIHYNHAKIRRMLAMGRIRKMYEKVLE